LQGLVPLQEKTAKVDVGSASSRVPMKKRCPSVEGPGDSGVDKS